MRIHKTFVAALMASAMVPAAALAETAATATADLNMRTGPGPNYAIVTTMPTGAEVVVNGCIDGSSWCEVSYGGQSGWASANYLQGTFDGQQVVIEQRRADIPVVSFAGDVVESTVSGALQVAGAAVDLALTPPRAAINFITGNPVDPVYLDGEVVVGAGVPASVELRPVPDYEYRYAYVNGQPVLVDPGTRQIVYVYR